MSRALRFWLPALLGVFASTANAADAPVAARVESPVSVKGTHGYLEQGWWWDLNVEGGLGVAVAPGHPLFGMGSVRAGALYMAEPWYLAAGGLFETSTFAPAAVGVQVEALNLWSGVWAQLGGLVNVHQQFGVQGSLGFALFGAETEVFTRSGSRPQVAVFLKIRVPVSWLLQVNRPSRLPRS